MNRKALLERKELHLKAIRAIATKTESENRNFTAAERAKVAEHSAAAAKAHQDILELDADEKMINEINSLGAPVGARRGRNARTAQRDGEWSKAMTDHLGRVGAKALTTSGSISVPSLSAGLVEIGDRPRSILQLIPFVPLTTGDEYGFIQETVRTQNASTVAVGKKKPESVYALEKITDHVKTIAHLATVDRSLVMDVDLLQAYLEGALRDGVELELEDQILLGNGSTAGVLDDMVGIINTPGTQTQAWDTSLLVTARKAVTKLESAYGGKLDPSGFAWVLDPADWERFELSTDSDHFVMGDPGNPGNTVPVDRARRTLWGYPVTTSLAMVDGTGLLGDFGGSVEIREREAVTVEWAQTGFVTDLFGAGLHGDLWEANKVRFRAEGRWGEAVTRPEAFIELDLTVA